MFASARRKLTVLLVSLFVILYVAMATAVYGFMSRITTGGIDVQLAADARILLRHERVLGIPARMQMIQYLFPQLSLVAVRDNEGRVLASTDPSLAARVLWPPTRPPSAPATTLHVKQTYRTLRVAQGGGFERMLSQPITLNGRQQYLVLLYRMNREARLLYHLEQVIWMVGLLGTGVAVVAGFFAAGQALQPIMRSWQRQQEFVADASHELRTPLAVIQLNLDVVLGHASESVSDNFEWLNNAKSESRRLVKLTENLLTLARADSNETVLAHEPVSLFDVAAKVIDSFQPYAAAKELMLTLEPEERSEGSEKERFSVWGDPDRLYQLAFILVDNAIKYTPAGGSIRVALGQHRQSVRLMVQDTGIGIPKEDLGRIFDRFYRGDPARERAHPGVGLGLSIAKWIAEKHGGRIHVQSSLDEGSEFTVTLPQSGPRGHGRHGGGK